MRTAAGWAALWAVAIIAVPAHAQDAVGDLLAGNLIKPKVGIWAWYDVQDTESGSKYVLRQAVVGKERVGRKTAWWVEFEIVPEVGYRSVYKMLVSGPAGDPRNVHAIVRKLGPGPVERVEFSSDPEAMKQEKEDRKKVGKEPVRTLSGDIEATHYLITRDGRRVDLWTNKDIRPSGIVRMHSDEGEMILRNYGEGGKAGQSLITEAPPETPAPDRKPDVDVQVGGDE
jgi:hypothetical protein